MSLTCFELLNSWRHHFHYPYPSGVQLFCVILSSAERFIILKYAQPYGSTSLQVSVFLPLFPLFQVVPQDCPNSWQLLPGLLMELALSIMWGICSQAERRVCHIFCLHTAIFHFNYPEHPTWLKDTACKLTSALVTVCESTEQFGPGFVDRVLTRSL